MNSTIFLAMVHSNEKTVTSTAFPTHKTTYRATFSSTFSPTLRSAKQKSIITALLVLRLNLLYPPL
jgi:hypothetical protein